MGSAPSVLVTGFEPFDGESLNPSAQVARSLDGERILDHRVIGAVLPVAHAATADEIERLISMHRPSLVLALGQAGGRATLSLERVAINLIDARIADERGLQPIDEPVVEGAPVAYLSGLPIKAIKSHLEALGVPVSLSFTAGSFVCNQVFYLLSHLAATRYPGLRSGFVHLPWLPEQATRRGDAPSMSLETMLRGVRAVIATALQVEFDLVLPGGFMH